MIRSAVFLAILIASPIAKSLSLRPVSRRVSDIFVNRGLPAAKPFSTRLHETTSSASKEPSAAQVLEKLYLQSAVLSAGAAVAEIVSPTVSGSPFLRHILPLYTTTALTGKTLSAAAKRNRLEGTTFKLLNVGMLIATIPTIMSTIPIVLSIPRLVEANEIVRAVSSALRLIHAYLTAPITYTSLLAFGLPLVKFSVVGPLSASYLALAAATLFGLPYLNAPPMFESAVSTSIFFALHGAAAAGQKRLSSHTYRAINASVILSSFFRLFGLVSTYPGRFRLSVVTNNLAIFAMPTIALATALVGLFKGVAYKETN